jgi:hypothetical protein
MEPSPWTLRCYSCNFITTQFVTKEKLKYSTHMFCLWIPCYKLYKEGTSFLIFSHLNTSVVLGWAKKKFNLKGNKILNKISWLFFNSLSLVLSYLLTYLPMVLYDLPSYIYIFQNTHKYAMWIFFIMPHVIILDHH